MKYLILAQPKSASTSLMFAIGNAGRLRFGQQFVLKERPRRLRDRALRRVVNSGLRALHAPLSVNAAISNSPTLRHAFPAPDYPALSCAHSDIADFEPNAVRRDTPSFEFELHKQHFPPTPNNVSFFEHVKKVVLIRDVDEAVESYLRVPIKTTNSVFRWLLSNNEQFQKQLTRELQQWQNGWVSFAGKRHDVLLITYNDLLSSPEKTVKKAIDFFGIKLVQNEILLPQKRTYR